MKKIYSAFALLAFSLSYSQVFTNGSIYDYSVGDTIIEQYQQFFNQFSQPGPPLTTRRVITGKSFSSNLDSIFYTEQQVKNQIIMYSNPPAIGYTNAVVHYTVTHLTDTLIRALLGHGPCQVSNDTTFVDSCGYKTHILDHLPIPYIGFCEPNTEKNTYIEGIGIFRHTVCNNCTNTGSGGVSKLIYAHKVGKPACGKAVSIITSVDQHVFNEFKLQVFPNPSTGVYNINSRHYGLVSVLDATGKTIFSQAAVPGGNRIDISNEGKGIYFLILQTEGNNSAVKIIKH